MRTLAERAEMAQSIRNMLRLGKRVCEIAYVFKMNEPTLRMFMRAHDIRVADYRKKQGHANDNPLQR
jgi:hypothetical protein